MMPDTQFTPFRETCGFTLIEILISLAISGIILTGILYVFDTSNRSYLMQKEVAQMQQNVRFSKFFVERDLRMTGYGIRGLGMNGSAVASLEFENNIDDEADILADTDRLTLRYIDDEQSGCGTNPGTLPACDQLPQLLLHAGMPAASTEAEVQEDLSVAPWSSWYDGCSCQGADYNRPHYGFRMIITSPDGSKSDLVYLTQVTNVNAQGGNAKLQNRQITIGGATLTNKVLNEYPTNSTINFFNSNTYVEAVYYIDADYNFIREVNGVPGKMAENIEDFQVAFAGDYNGDNTFDVEDEGDWFDNADLTAGQMDDTDLAAIRYVRVTLLGRTQRQHDGMANTRPAIEDHSAGTSQDRYARRQLTFTVKIRNLAL